MAQGEESCEETGCWVVTAWVVGGGRSLSQQSPVAIRAARRDSNRLSFFPCLSSNTGEFIVAVDYPELDLWMGGRGLW
jgi:hypothetical protein